MKHFMLGLFLAGAVTLAMPAWAQQDQQDKTCPEGQTWDDVQQECVTETQTF